MGAYSNDEMVISASKVDLLETLNKNLIKHNVDYVGALAGWQKEVDFYKAELVQCLAKTDDHEKYTVHMTKLRDVILDMPTSHASDYETAIEMLEWHQGTEFKLERSQFRQYVQNIWDWHRSFSQTTLRFSG